jgi:hypothetical protein
MADEEQKADLVFLSYAKPDQDRVLEFADALSANGLNVWIDCKELKAGHNWDFEIKRALTHASLIVVFLSENSVDRRGYVQREIKIALDKYEEKLVSDIYIIPVLLDDNAIVPEALKGIQWVRASDANCMQELEASIRHQLQKLGLSVAQAQNLSNVRWTKTSHRDRWEGLPGYRSEFQLLRFSSDEYPHASEMTDIIRGELLSEMMTERSIKFDQDTSLFNFGQERFARTNSWDAYAGDPLIVGKIISIRYTISLYGAGAAHPNHYIRTFCFVLDPMLPIKRIQHIFTDEERAFEIIKECVRDELRKKNFSDDDSEPIRLDEDGIVNGTMEWNDFRAFVFDEHSIEFAFDAMAAYVFGTQYAKVAYRSLADLMKPEYRSAIGHGYLTYPEAWPSNTQASS